MSPDTCPHCGADVPANAKACPECGADESTGWSEQARYDSLDLPDEDFNYEEFTQREFGGESKARPRGVHWVWWLVALLLAGSLMFAAFRFVLAR